MIKSVVGRRDLLAAAGAVIVASVLIEGLQHWLMAWADMAVYHAVSAVLTVLLVAVAVWQRDVRLRWLEAQARAEALTHANAELRRALKELSRSDQLAAAGASAAMLSERLSEALIAAGPNTLPVSHRDDLELILEELQDLAHTSRRSMRPVDVGSLTQWVAAEVATKASIRIYCLAPDRPVWVKANPARLEMAIRHFIAHVAGPAADDQRVIVIDAREGCAAIAIEGPSAGIVGGLEPQALNWRIARAVVTECGGSLAVIDEPGGVVYTIYLPLGPEPRALEADELIDVDDIRPELEELAAQNDG